MGSERPAAATLLSDLDRAVVAHPEKVAAVGIDTETNVRRMLTYAQLNDEVDRVARGLRALGVGPGDVVSVQLPNVLEFPVLLYAVLRIGAVFNGLTAIFRDREVEFILRRTASKVYVVPSVFRRYDFPAMARRMRAVVPTLEHVVVVPKGSAESVPADTVAWAALGGPPAEPAPVSPDDLAQIAFTSGTTGEPKGVMHSHRSLRQTVARFHEHVVMPEPVVNLVVSPVGHQTGFLWGTVLSTHLAGTAVYLDIWNPSRAWEVIRQEGVTAMIAAAPFLRDLVEDPAAGGGPHGLRVISIPGAPIPRALVPRAQAELGARIVPSWGMTEYGIALAVGVNDPVEAYATDGSVVPGATVRVVDAANRPVGPEVEGDLQIRGEGLFLGYFKRPDLTADSFVDGWFQTGDRAVVTRGGFVRITGRSKDIIIRGGENVPVQEVENLLFTWPAIREVAIVAMPDERLGEKACAYVVPAPGVRPTLQDMQEFLRAKGLTPQYWPERLELIDALPRTPSGKIQKFLLREDIRRRLGAE
jgi:cyclohexanecarboxylate-CoA ligase